MVLVSVVLPCFNSEATLGATLSSLEQQTLANFELVAVDDGSTDSTRSILETWAARDGRFKIITQPHSGVIAAANRGMDASQGKYLARMDADDIADPQRLMLQVNYLERHPETAVVGSLVEMFAEEETREGYRLYVQWLNSLRSNEDIRREIFVESPLANPSVMIRTDWMRRMGGYEDHGWAEDYDLWLRMYLAGATFSKIPRVLLRWRDHPARVTRTDSRYSLANFLKAKAFYLARGPLIDRDAVIIWGAGMMGRRLGKHLQRQDLPLAVYVDIDPKKIGRTRRGCPIIEPDDLGQWWEKYNNPVILAAVGARRARGIIRERLNAYGFLEGRDWWATA